MVSDGKPLPNAQLASASNSTVVPPMNKANPSNPMNPIWDNSCHPFTSISQSGSTHSNSINQTSHIFGITPTSLPSSPSENKEFPNTQLSAHTMSSFMSMEQLMSNSSHGDQVTDTALVTERLDVETLLVAEKPSAAKTLMADEPSMVKSLVVDVEKPAKTSMMTENPPPKESLVGDKTAHTELVSENQRSTKSMHVEEIPVPRDMLLDEFVHLDVSVGNDQKVDVVRSTVHSTCIEVEEPVAKPWNLRLRGVENYLGLDASDGDDQKKKCTFDEHTGDDVEEPLAKTWNLRPRKSATKQKGLKKQESSDCQAKVAEESVGSRTGKQGKATAVKTNKFSLTLTKKEIEDDFLILTGSMPPKKPKGRPRNVQRELDLLFPGSSLGSVSTKAYGSRKG